MQPIVYTPEFNNTWRNFIEQQTDLMAVCSDENQFPTDLQEIVGLTNAIFSSRYGVDAIRQLCMETNTTLAPIYMRTMHTPFGVRTILAFDDNETSMTKFYLCIDVEEVSWTAFVGKGSDGYNLVWSGYPLNAVSLAYKKLTALSFDIAQPDAEDLFHLISFVRGNISKVLSS